MYENNLFIYLFQLVVSAELAWAIQIPILPQMLVLVRDSLQLLTNIPFVLDSEPFDTYIENIIFEI